MHESEKWKWSRSVVSDSSDPTDCSLPGSSIQGIFEARVLEWGAIAFSEPTPPKAQLVKELQFFESTEEGALELWNIATCLKSLSLSVIASQRKNQNISNEWRMANGR